MKILYVTTISNTVNAFFIPHIKTLIEQGSKVDVAFNITQDISPEIYEMNCKVHNLPFQRSIFNKYNYMAYKGLKKIFIDEKYDIVHTHTPIASAICRLVCRNTKDIKVIYTAHGFHFFRGAPLINWLIYYPIEKWLSKYTDLLITINKEDYNRAKRSFKAGKIKYIPGVGVDTKKFRDTVINKTEKRKEIGIPNGAFMVLSVGELNKNKNHETIIKAIAKLKNPNIIYVICGRGPLKKYLTEMSKKLKIEEQVKLLGYRGDISEICKVADIFAFPSKREGLGLAAIEAMAAGLPIVTSNIHGIIDYSIDGVTGYTCSPKDVDRFSEVIMNLYKNKDLRVEIGTFSMQNVQKFDFKNVMPKIKEIYESLL